MKLFRQICFLLLVSSFVFGQSAPNNTNTDDSRISNQIKTLQDAIASQQQQIEQLRQELAARKQADSAPHLANAALTTHGTTSMVQETEKPKESPLSFRIGGTDFPPGGFVYFQNIFRTVNTGNVISTNFGAIPFSNTAAGHLTEYRASGQYSRWNLKIAGKYGANNITGYVEGDFNGNDAANVFATTNPHTLRMRLFFVDLRRGLWKSTGAQAWSLITPNRVGTSPMPADLATTYSTDGNIHVGMPYSRDGQFRLTLHPNDNFSWAIAVDNPQQYTNGEVTVPTTFNAVLTPQLDGAATAGVPNLIPDIMTKMAWDTKMGSRAFHLEGGGLVTSVKVTAVPGGTTAFGSHSNFGTAGMGGLNLELAKNFRVMAYGLYGTGTARYFNGLGPQYVVAPIATGPGTFTIDTSMVHAGTAYTGIEATMGKTQLGAYYGGYYFGRNSFNDLTAAAVATPVSCAPGLPAINRPCIGLDRK